MKKFIKQLAVIFILMNLALTIQMAFAAPTTPPSAANYYGPLQMVQAVGRQTGLPDFYTQGGQHPEAPPDYVHAGAGTVTSPILYIIDLFRYFMSGIALIIIVAQAIKLIATANDEEAEKAKKTLIMGGVGLILIQLAHIIVNKVFFGEEGEAFEDPATTVLYAEEGVKYIRGIIGFIEILLGAGAVLVIVVRGIMLVTSGGEEEKVTKAKNHIMYAIIGLVVVILAEVIVRGVIFPESGEVMPDVEKGRYLIVSITNYISFFISIIAFLMLFYAGYRYVIAGGSEEANEKVKKIMIGAIISLVLAMSAFAIVNTVIDIEPVVLDRGEEMQSGN